MLNWFLDFRISGRRPRRGPDGRSAGRPAAGRTAATGRFRRRRGRQKAAPCCEARRGSFDRASGRGRAVSIPGTKAAPIYIAFWRSSYASGSSRASPPVPAGAGRRANPDGRGVRKEGRERTLCRETMLRTPPPPRKLFLPPSEFTAGGQESKPRGSRGLQDGGGCCRCNLFEVITLWLDL